MSETTTTRGVPVNEFDWAGNGLEMQYLTCRNHTHLRWLTKHPRMRTLHYIGKVDGSYEPECPCPLADLVVIPEKDAVLEVEA